VLLVIADVSGKGVPAALVMSGFRASLMSQDAHALGPDRIAGRVNEFLHRSVETGKFVTAFLGFLEAGSGRLVYANAGHNPPALLKADGTVEWLSAGGLVLGIMPQPRFESGETRLAPGDLLALYTDGVTEGANAAGDLWGEDRLIEALGRLRDRACAEAAEALVREVRAFEGDTGPADDVTVLLARRV
jgi:sigma-B regulation protein RsbU (phosphoserine phosphatase)